jgi:hypothetical protein
LFDNFLKINIIDKKLLTSVMALCPSRGACGVQLQNIAISNGVLEWHVVLFILMGHVHMTEMRLSSTYHFFLFLCLFSLVF